MTDAILVEIVHQIQKTTEHDADKNLLFSESGVVLLRGSAAILQRYAQQATRELKIDIALLIELGRHLVL